MYRGQHRHCSCNRVDSGRSLSEFATFLCSLPIDNAIDERLPCPRKANLGGPFLAHVQFCVTQSRHAVFSYESGASNGKELLELEQKPFHFSVHKYAVS